MSEQINKVLASTAQSFTTAQQAQARENIGAIGYANLNYSGTTITGIGGSAVGSTGGGSVYHDSNLTGSGTSAVPLGIANPVLLSSNVHSSWYGATGAEMSGTGGYVCINGDNVIYSGSAGPYISSQIKYGTLHIGDTANTSQSIYMQWKNGNACQMEVRGTYGSKPASATIMPHGMFITATTSNDEMIGAEVTPFWINIEGRSATADLRDDCLRMGDSGNDNTAELRTGSLFLKGPHWDGVGTANATYNQHGVYFRQYDENRGYTMNAKYEISAIRMEESSNSRRYLSVQPNRVDWHQGGEDEFGNNVYWDNDVGSLHLNGGLSTNAGIDLLYGSASMVYLDVYDGNGMATMRGDQLILEDKGTAGVANRNHMSLSHDYIVIHSATGTGTFDFVETRLDYDTITSLSAWAKTQGWTGGTT